MVKIELCDFLFDVKIKYKYTYDFIKDYLSFSEKDADFEIVISEEDLAFEQKKVPSYPLPYHETLCLYRKICNVLSHHGVFMMHSSVVVHQGYAYIFTAKSGTGKTTHSRLWLKNFPDSFIINGDKPLFRFKDGEFFVYGSPWSGKEGYNRNTSSKIGALCFINQSEDNYIHTITAKEVLLRVFEQLYIPPDKTGGENVLSLMNKFLETVPAYVLGCNISDEAALLAEKTMNKRKADENEN